MKWVFYCLFALQLLIFTVNCKAQSAYKFINYTVADGLSQSNVTTILEDNLHGIWIGTQEGLNHFNGTDFIVYNRGNTKAMTSAFITSSITANNGDLWFGTSNGLLGRDNKTAGFKSYFRKSNESIFIEQIKKGKDGLLWILTQESQLFCFNSIKKQFVSIPSFVPQTRINFLYTTPDGSLVLGQENNGIYYCDLLKGSKTHITLPNVFGEKAGMLSVACSYDNNKKILLYCNNNFFSYVIKTKVLTKEFDFLKKTITSPIVSMLKVNDSWLFACDGQGLFQVGAKGDVSNSAEDIFQKNTLLNNMINCMIIDRSGVGWLGSDRGLSSFNPRQKSFLAVGPSDKKEKGLPSQNVWAINESVRGDYTYIGTDVGVTRIGKAKGDFQHFEKIGEQENIGVGSVLCIEVLPNETLLLGCFDGFYSLNPNATRPEYKKIKLKLGEQSNEHQRIYSIVKYSSHEYFLGTNSGVLLWDIESGKTKDFIHDPFEIDSTISKGICRTIYQDKNKKFWFATTSGGLNYWDTDRLKIIPHPINDIIFSLSKDMLTSICQINDDEYFIGTHGSGLLKVNFSSNIVELYSDKNGLPNNVIYGILKATDDVIWMSTNKGISKFNFVTKEFKNYDELNGLICNEFNSNAYFKAKNGAFFFGGIYGFNYFIPSSILTENQLCDVKITSVEIESNKSNPTARSLTPYQLNNNGVLELDYDQRGFTINFQPTNLISPKLIQYKYILIGDQMSDTNIISNSNSVSFNSLSWGEYTIKIYARIADGEWSKNPAILKVKINPPYWATIPFWLLIIFSLSIIIYVIMRLRTNNIRRENIRLEMKIAFRTREILKQKQQIESQNTTINQEKNKVLEQQKLLFKEKEKTEKWLKNTLPLQVVEELKIRGKVYARAYENVSVMFTDVVGFTKIAESMTPTSLVSRLDIIFRRFDTIALTNNLEKIKTIGDAYMAAGGIPDINSTHPIDACLAALQIQAYMNELKNEAIANKKDYWQLRIGINTGPVTAGVIGKLKIAYDVWGATVNQAQRMEMLSEPGKVTISESTFTFIEPYFVCEYKGKALTKSKSLVDTYVIHSIKTELSEDGEGLIPNDRFYQIVQLHLSTAIKYHKVEHDIINKLKEGLKKELLYHSVDHTIDVVNAVERIALSEGLADDGLFLLKTAALFHDAGFLKKYDSNESIGAKMASLMLPKYGYSEQDINIIIKLIHVTEIPHKPLNQLQEIMCDADLDYLGRNDFEVISNKLKQELKTMKKIKSDRKWDETQVKFFNQHKYFTPTAIQSRSQKKQENLAVILARLEENNYTD